MAVSDAAKLGDRSKKADYIYGKKRLREIDSREHFLIKRLEGIALVDRLQHFVSEMLAHNCIAR
ncbi:hypothetical protein [Microbulbifer hainanensis]|uniref:hypothetical protein n=1 Tax=Microbulbifer hainanensis TaxID=2735675 RepID=UPI0029C0E469|nr:hypothetical protein [Microbulbifer hainanensis]